MVILSSITTGGGDDGQTRLADLSTISKADPLLEAVGALAEANAVLGLARSHGLSTQLDAWASRLQQEWFDLGADLATPLPDSGSTRPAARHVTRISPAQIDAWRQTIQFLAKSLGPLTSFVIPGGPPPAAYLHLTTTVLRRAERAAWVGAEARGIDRPGGLSHSALIYLNRASDLTFLMSRVAGGEQAGLWRSGGG
jgi:cob(I)alamin adenosyltransferase